MGQQINKTVWLSDDGKKEFDTQADMIAYESRNRWQALVTDMQSNIDISGYQTERAGKAALTRLESGALLMLGYLDERGLLSPVTAQHAASLAAAQAAQAAPPPVAAAA